MRRRSRLLKRPLRRLHQHQQLGLLALMAFTTSKYVLVGVITTTTAYQIGSQQQPLPRCRSSTYRRLLRDVGEFCIGDESLVRRSSPRVQRILAGGRTGSSVGRSLPSGFDRTSMTGSVGEGSRTRRKTVTTTTTSTTTANRARRSLYSPHEEEGDESSSGTTPMQPQKRSIPTVPSSLFRKLAESQLELLANSIYATSTNSDDKNDTTTTATTSVTKKIRSTALYLPAENALSGQLEFTPAILFPNPKNERVFIANDSSSGVPPTLPRTLTSLPGFSHAKFLIPRYPMVSISTTEPGIGVVEEVVCDVSPAGGGATALSVPLFSGSQTVGVLLVSPSTNLPWTKQDRRQVAKAAQSVSLALSMETERAYLAERHQSIQYALSESLHQVKNPLQALRTYGKLLQQRMASVSSSSSSDRSSGSSPSTSSTTSSRLLELADHLVQQSDRLVDRLKPVDELVASLSVPLALLKPAEEKALVPYYPRPPLSLSFQQQQQVESDDTINNNESSSAALATRSNAVVANHALLVEEVDPSSPGSSLSPPTNFLGDVQVEMSFVPDVLQPVLSSFAGILEEAGITFKVVGMDDDLPGVIVWPVALQEAVINLLDNAVKYNTHPSPQIRVRLLPHRDRRNNSNGGGGGVTILIEDNGPGISPQEASAVFERGYRGNNGIVAKGSGIGLTIARSLVEQMGGSLRWVPSGTYPNSLGGTTMELKIFRKGTNQQAASQ